MSRPLRIEFQGAVYHITSRGNAKQNIYLEDANRHKFIDILKESCDRYNWRCHAYCLMTNHYHLLIETPDANLSRGMRHLNGVYSSYFNKHFDRVGHLFQGRFTGLLVDKQLYLLELSRYILLNPVRAKMVFAASEWPWSSYHHMLSHSNGGWLFSDWLLSQFGNDRIVAARRFIQFMADGKHHPSPLLELKQQLFLGSDEFIKHTLTHISDNLYDVPKTQARPPALTLQEYAQRADNRNGAIKSAYRSGEYSMKAIAQFFSLHYTTVSRVVNGK